MLMKTESPCVPAGHVPIGGWSAAQARLPRRGSATVPAAPAPMRMKSRRLGWGFLSSCIAVSKVDGHMTRTIALVQIHCRNLSECDGSGFGEYPFCFCCVSCFAVALVLLCCLVCVFGSL